MGLDGLDGTSGLVAGAPQAVTVAGDQNNWDPAGLIHTSVLEITLNPDAATTITGIVKKPDGFTVYIINESTATLTLPHNSASSAVGNRFASQHDGNAPILLLQGMTAALVYDASAGSGTGYWRVFLPVAFGTGTAAPLGTAAEGTSGRTARADHVHSATLVGPLIVQSAGSAVRARASDGSNSAALISQEAAAGYMAIYKSDGTRVGYIGDSETNLAVVVDIGKLVVTGAVTASVAPDNTPVTQAFADVAAKGSGLGLAYDDHKHGMPANPISDGKLWDTVTELALDFVVTNSSTLATVTGFTQAVAAGDVWEVEVHAVASGNNTTGDIIGDLVFTSGTTATTDAWWEGTYWNFNGVLTVKAPSAPSSTTVFTASVAINNGDGVLRPVVLIFRFRVATSGTVAFQTANAAAGSGRTSTISAGAKFFARKLTPV